MSDKSHSVSGTDRHQCVALDREVEGSPESCLWCLGGDRDV